LGFTTI